MGENNTVSHCFENANHLRDLNFNVSVPLWGLGGKAFWVTVFTPSLSEACVILVTTQRKEMGNSQGRSTQLFPQRTFLKIQFTFGDIFSLLRMFQIADSVSPGS